ncbi:hypothetical protein [Pannonibacter sp. SL95]|nr:hypothetical protein [Pannonibacter sp. SL95]MCY1707719.1 hypothetical protein [Pannonibacter sp. SL95]
MLTPSNMSPPGLPIHGHVDRADLPQRARIRLAVTPSPVHQS